MMAQAGMHSIQESEHPNHTDAETGSSWVRGEFGLPLEKDHLKKHGWKDGSAVKTVVLNLSNVMTLKQFLML